MRFFTSDQHFGHHNIIRFCDRPFRSVDEMDAAIIDAWNATITNADEVYVLGDFAMKVSLGRVGEIVRSLRGHAKHLIMGNHDRHKAHHYVKAGFTTARRGEILESRHRVNGETIPLYLQHHPVFKVMPERGHDHWILCGHVHQRWTIQENQRLLNVGVDVHNFKPISEARVVEMIQEAEDGPFCL